MIRRVVMTIGALSILVAVAGTARTEGEQCLDDSDCAEGEQCLMVPCAVPCDPDDESCDYSCDEVRECVSFDDPFMSECETEDDCPDGFICEEVGAIACPDVACPEGADCPESPPCDEEPFSACVPAPCLSDADCGEGMVCLTVTYEICHGLSMPDPDCTPDGDCPDSSDEPATDPECEEYSESFCAPPWIGPCTSDEDCGEGFDCVEVEICSCSGGGTVPIPPDPEEGDSSGGDEGGSEGSGTGDETEPPDDIDCSCEPLGEFYCQPQEILCEDAGDCPDDWECQEFGFGTMACTYDTETGDEVCESSEELGSYCVPPFWDDWGYGASEGYEEALDQASGGSNSRVDSSAKPPSPSGEDSDQSGGRPESDSGCQVVSGNRISLFGLFALFFMVFCLRRRN